MGATAGTATPMPMRQRARRHVTAAISLLVCAAFLLRLGSGPVALATPWILFLLMLYALAACLWWAAAALRHPRPDPWAYDPELDGPVAQEMEGRSFPPPAAAPPLAGPTALWLVLAVVFLLAGAWLVGVASSVYGNGRGAEAPSLAALALYLCAAGFAVAGPWLAWTALRGAGRRARP